MHHSKIVGSIKSADQKQPRVAFVGAISFRQITLNPFTKIMPDHDVTISNHNILYIVS